MITQSRSSRYVLWLFHPWLLNELDFVSEVRKNYRKYIDIFMEIWQVNIYERDMYGFSSCDGRSHIIESSKIFRKVHIRNNSLGNCQLKFLKFSLKVFYDFSLTSWHTCICGWYYSAHVTYASLWDKWTSMIINLYGLWWKTE